MDDSSPLPEFEEGFIEVPVSYEELFTLIKTLEYSNAAFIHLSQEAITQGDAPLGDVFKARAELCKAFAQKLTAVAQVGQPTDGSKH